LRQSPLESIVDCSLNQQPYPSFLKMLDLGIILLSLLNVLGFFVVSQWPMKRPALLRALGVATNRKNDEDSSVKSRFQLIKEINNMARKNEIAATMADLIRTDGAGS
jgi:hypothetical protein